MYRQLSITKKEVDGADSARAQLFEDAGRRIPIGMRPDKNIALTP
jgi:hypothetical protein